MRGYQCYYYRLDGEKFIKNDNHACWAGLGWKNDVKSIYIEDYGDDEKWAKRITWIINKITPCKVVTIKDKKYIQYDLIQCDDFYCRNLFLLNFIRYLWNEPEKGMSELFFAELAKTRGNKDVIFRLTTANRAAYLCKDGYNVNGGHSNAYKHAKVRTTEDFLNHNFTSVSSFLK
jgi:hypothetical protein